MSDLAVVVTFGSGALIIFSAVYFFFDRGLAASDAHAGVTGSRFSITFARLFGLITVAVLGGGLAFSKVSAEFAASAYTLLGTIAGYLAGAKPTAEPENAAPPPNNGAQEEEPPRARLPRRFVL